MLYHNTLNTCLLFLFSCTYKNTNQKKNKKKNPNNRCHNRRVYLECLRRNMNMLRFPGSSTMSPQDCSLSKARGIAATFSIIFQKRYEIFYHQKRYAKNPVFHIPFFRILYYFILLFITFYYSQSFVNSSATN